MFITRHSSLPQLEWHSLCYTLQHILFSLEFPLSSTYYDALVVSPSCYVFFNLISSHHFSFHVSYKFYLYSYSISSTTTYHHSNILTLLSPSTSSPLLLLHSFSSPPPLPLPPLILYCPYSSSSASFSELLHFPYSSSPPLLHPLSSLFTTPSTHHSSLHPCRHHAHEQWR